MKKRMIYGIMTVILTLSLCACNKKQEKEQEQATTEAADTNEESEDSVVLNSEEYVTLPEYKGIEVTVPVVEAKDEDISQYITENMLTGYEITDRPVQPGDVVNIDYIGKKDGVAFEGGTAEGYDLTIGSGQFIDGFEDGLIGAEKGQTVELNLIFPENYKKELAGQDVVFTVTVNAIKATTDYDNLTDEQLVSMNIGFDNKKDLWEAGKEAYQKQLEDNRKMDIQNAVYEKLMSETAFAELPESVVDEKAKDYNDYMEDMCQQYYGCSLEDYITSNGRTMDEYNEQVKQMATEETKQQLLLDAIAKNEAIELTDEEVNQKAQEIADQYGYDSVESFYKLVGEDEYRLSLLQQKVIEFLGDNAVVTE